MVVFAHHFCRQAVLDVGVAGIEEEVHIAVGLQALEHKGVFRFMGKDVVERPIVDVVGQVLQVDIRALGLGIARQFLHGLEVMLQGNLLGHQHHFRLDDATPVNDQRRAQAAGDVDFLLHVLHGRATEGFDITAQRRLEVAVKNRFDSSGRDLRLQTLDTRLGPVIDHFAEQAAVDVPVGAVAFDGGLQALFGAQVFLVGHTGAERDGGVDQFAVHGTIPFVDGALKFDGHEIGLGHAAIRACPVFRHLFPRGACGNSVFRNAQFFYVHKTAGCAHISLHGNAKSIA